MADVGHLSFDDDFAAADFMLDEVGVATVPGSSFYHQAELGRWMLRFTLSKSDATIAAAEQRLPGLSAKLRARTR
jgi:aspartate/methionine/tyrosine aminotransferase